MAAERLHGDDTTVPVLAKGRTETGRCWTYVRDHRPFGGPEPPVAIFYFSRGRKAEHPQAHLAAWSGILQADAYGGYNPLFQRTARLDRQRSVLSPFQVLLLRGGRPRCGRPPPRAGQDRRGLPVALEVVRRMGLLFTIERAINGLSAGERLTARQQHSASIVADLERYMREERAKLPRGIGVAVPLDYILEQWQAFVRFLDDGRICLTSGKSSRSEVTARKATFAGYLPDREVLSC